MLELRELCVYRVSFFAVQQVLQGFRRHAVNVVVYGHALIRQNRCEAVFAALVILDEAGCLLIREIGVFLARHHFCCHIAVISMEHRFRDVHLFVGLNPLRFKCQCVNQHHNPLRTAFLDQRRDHLMRVVIDPVVDVFDGAVIKRSGKCFCTVVILCCLQECLRHFDAVFVFVYPKRIGKMQCGLLAAGQPCRVVVVILVERFNVQCITEQLFHFRSRFAVCTVCRHRKRLRNGQRRNQQILARGLLIICCAFQQIDGQLHLAVDERFVSCLAGCCSGRHVLCEID